MGANRTVAIVFFDGECNLCNSFVNFVIERDAQNCFRFSSLQSRLANEIFSERMADHEIQQTVILKMGDGLYFKSDAALEIARKLNGVWPAFYFFKIVPKFIRDFIYDFIASHRYKWFGKSSCLRPSTDLKARFLE